MIENINNILILSKGDRLVAILDYKQYLLLKTKKEI